MTKAVVHLSERLDMQNARPLAAAILDQAGQDLELDASNVAHFGALGIQVVRSAAKSWARSGHSLVISGLSNDCADQIQLLGFSPDNLCEWEGDV